MIITKQKPIQEILDFLKDRKKIFLIGCGDCAATCKTGGEEELKRIAELLKEQGKEITGMIVPEVTCVSAQVKVASAKNKDALKQSEAIVVFACGSGTQCVKENDRYKIDVYPGCDSLFTALIDKDNSFAEVCSCCGECVLALTEGICPVTRCSKGLLNGPCGGQNKGKCEVDKDRDCAWILIYNRLKDKGRLDLLKKRLPPRDYRKSSKPGKVTL